MASRFTQARKEDILKDFRIGKSSSHLSKEYGCTPATITRIVKSFLSEEEYSELKLLRRKSNSRLHQKDLETLATQQNELQLINQAEVGLEQSSNEESLEHESLSDHDFSQDGEAINKSLDEFAELIPLVTNFEWDQQQEVACKPYSEDLLPETVFMLVDKTVELESKPLKEFSQWSFLPEKDQDRLAILLFSNQRSAKRSCSRNQRVLKVPNSSIFQKTFPHLISKGITRIILDDSLISIDI